jgi:hypothetical protein
MSQILAIRGEVRNHPLTFEFAIEYNKGVGSRRTAPAQGIETFEFAKGLREADPTDFVTKDRRRGLKPPGRLGLRRACVTKDRPCAGD